MTSAFMLCPHTLLREGLMTKEHVERVTNNMILKKKEMDYHIKTLQSIKLQNIKNRVLGEHHVVDECVWRLRIKECADDVYVLDRLRINYNFTLTGITNCLNLYFSSYSSMLTLEEKIVFTDFIISHMYEIPFAIELGAPDAKDTLQDTLSGELSRS